MQGHWERLCTRFLGHQLLTVHLHSVGMLSYVVIVKITVKSSPVNLDSATMTVSLFKLYSVNCFGTTVMICTEQLSTSPGLPRI